MNLSFVDIKKLDSIINVSKECCDILSKNKKDVLKHINKIKNTSHNNTNTVRKGNVLSSKFSLWKK